MKPKIEQGRDSQRWRDSLKHPKRAFDESRKKKELKRKEVKKGRTGKKSQTKEKTKPERHKKKVAKPSTANPSTAQDSNNDQVLSGALRISTDNHRRSRIFSYSPSRNRTSASGSKTLADSSRHTTRSSSISWTKLKDSDGANTSVWRKIWERLISAKISPVASRDADLKHGAVQASTAQFETGDKSLQDQDKGKALRELMQSMAQNRNDSREFVTAWETKALPSLEKLLAEEYGGDVTICVLRGSKPGQRVVQVMSVTKLPAATVEAVEKDVFENLPDTFRDRTKVETETGRVERCRSAAGASSTSSKAPDDHFGAPFNDGLHNDVMMGDSVAAVIRDPATNETQKLGNATLGPLVEFGDDQYWLVNLHVFEHDGLKHWEETTFPPNYELIHPGIEQDDSNVPLRCLGVPKAHSGKLYYTTRPSTSVQRYFPHRGNETNFVITDWALCQANERFSAQHCNRLRTVPIDREVEPYSSPVIEKFCGNPQSRLIHSTGRNCGYRYALVCETPASFKQAGQRTREWFVENDPSIQTTEDWNLHGLGVPGDSGAGIVDFESTKLIGQLWGRNIYGGDHSKKRITYFTSVIDLFEDIAERYPELGTPTLGSGPISRCPKKPAPRAKVPSLRRINDDEAEDSSHHTGLESPYQSETDSKSCNTVTVDPSSSPSAEHSQQMQRSSSKKSDMTHVGDADEEYSNSLSKIPSESIVNSMGGVHAGV